MIDNDNDDGDLYSITTYFGANSRCPPPPCAEPPVIEKPSRMLLSRNAESTHCWRRIGTMDDCFRGSARPTSALGRRQIVSWPFEVSTPNLAKSALGSATPPSLNSTAFFYGL